jgi:sulfoquinovose isomerase
MTAWTDRPSHQAWLRTESLRLLDFGRGVVPTTRGAGWLDDDGVIDPARGIFTWITGRTAHVYALGHLLGVPGAGPVATRAIAALRTSLHDDEFGGWYASLAPDGTPDTTKSAYAHAFVVLAASTAVVAKIDGGRELLDDALAVLDERFWEPGAGLSTDEWDRTWTTLDPYRGVNANMHTVEAMLGAGDATGDVRWYERAASIADHVVTWASANHWRIPEHFDADWVPQLELNADKPGDPFKPYGATIGHGLEWSRLLLQVDAALPGRSPGTLIPAARALYDGAVRDGWAVDGAPGFVYTTDWTGAPVVRTRTAPGHGRGALRRGLRPLVGLRRRRRHRPRPRVVAPRAGHDEHAERRGVARQAGPVPRVPGHPAAAAAAGAGSRRRGAGRLDDRLVGER